MPAFHVMRLHESREEDCRQLMGLVELCRREAIKYFVHESVNALSRMDMTGEGRDLYVRRKTINGDELVPVQIYSDLLQKYNEKIKFTDFFVLREEQEKFQRAILK